MQFFFKSYWGINFLFGIFAFIGSWKFYLVLIKMFPSSQNKFAFVLFFFPSIIFWSSGYLKDPLSQGSLMLFLYAFIQLFYFNKKRISLYFLLLLSARIIIIIKSYIFFVLLPFIFYLIFIRVNRQNEISKYKKYSFNLALTIVLFYFGNYLLNNPDFIGRYALDSILEEIQLQKEGYTNIIDQGSFINMAEFDDSIIGLIKMFPTGLEISFLRPYIWESSNLLMLFASFENLIIYFFILKILLKFKFNFYSMSKKILKNKLALIFFFYSILLGAFIGISNPNFGTISRYRIPAVSMLLISLIMIGNESNSLKKQDSKKAKCVE